VLVFLSSKVVQKLDKVNRTFYRPRELLQKRNEISLLASSKAGYTSAHSLR
jgi:hypothetical protein